MQRFAFDEKNTLVFIENAKKGISYYCPECKATLRAKFGAVRAPHFFHLQQSDCRLSQKSIEHIKVQEKILEQLGLLPQHMEVFFPGIQRIGDVVFPQKKIIFEIQCSNIDPKEVLRRMKDYKKEGHEVLWILHDKFFNKVKLTPCEEVLQSHTHYYTNIDHKGIGIFYDQHEKMKFPIQISSIDRLCEIKRKIRVPKCLERRVQTWKFYAKNDAFDKYLQDKYVHKCDFFEITQKKESLFYLVVKQIFIRIQAFLFKISKS